MGEAKRRGTYEERRSAAIERNGIEREELRRRLAEKRAAESEAEKQRRQEAAMCFAQMISMAHMSGCFPYTTPRGMYRR